LRRTVGAVSGAGTEALLASDEGRALVELGILEERDGRLIVARPLMTDAVHRSLLGLERPIVLVDSDA
jgi:hypothetical protein